MLHAFVQRRVFQIPEEVAHAVPERLVLHLWFPPFPSPSQARVLLDTLDLELVVAVVVFGLGCVRIDLERAEVGLTRARRHFGRGGP